MQHSELSDFTHEELAKFTHSDLHKTVEKLKTEIEKYGSDIPYNVYAKLCDLCDDVNNSLAKTGNPQIQKPKMSVTSLVDCVYKLAWIAAHYSELQNFILEAFDHLMNLLH